MELKPYQQQVLNDLTLYLDKVQDTKNIHDAFSQFWNTHPRTPLVPTSGAIIEPYKNNVKGVPHVCVKVPTAGGKTFIASNALKNIFDAYSSTQKRAVVWLVPSITILEQTLRNLQDPYHPYRQKINTYFRNRVEVYDKIALLNGSNFNASTVKENLSIFVMSFDSLRAKKKEDRKVYQENGNLLSFEPYLLPGEELTLMNIIRSLNPVVVVDESHNAETDLSVEMLQNLNPSFILDLTATPRNNSNIISFVDAFELKKENMVKLPVIVYNQHGKTEVIASAIKMQRQLEQIAKQEQKAGGKYIRPIVLLQAQPKSKEDNTTFEKIKDILIKSNIPEEQIKIKTATINEIKGIDLMSKDCEVRYIITINALKEGWDCPFAYVLASLADKSSAVDVEQILGRILRQPYVTNHANRLLNMSYVLTASSKFQDTLKNIVKGLNKAGFSSKDYKVADSVTNIDGYANKNNTETESPLTDLFNAENTEQKSDDDLENIDSTVTLAAAKEDLDAVQSDPVINTIIRTGIQESENMDMAIINASKTNTQQIPTDLTTMVNTISIKKVFEEQAQSIRLPQFYMGKTSDLFGDEDILLDKNALLADFPLDKASIDIDFSTVSSEMYKVDLDTTKKDNTPSYLQVDGKEKNILSNYLAAPATSIKAKIKTLSTNIKRHMGSMSPIPEQMIDTYLRRILETFTNEQYLDFTDYLPTYSERIRKKINEEAELYARKQFKKLLNIDQIELKPSYSFAATINPLDNVDFLPKSLYEKEGKMNKFEIDVINEVGNMDNVLFWTRNIERKGFKINAFINHYPDFIIVTKRGNIVVLETKGDHLDAEEKIELGNTWASKAGKGFRYYLVYNDKEVDGAYRKDDFWEIMKEL